MIDTAAAAAAAATSGDDDGEARRLPAGDDRNEDRRTAVVAAGETLYPPDVVDTLRAATNEVLTHKSVILSFNQRFRFFCYRAHRVVLLQ